MKRQYKSRSRAAWGGFVASAALALTPVDGRAAATEQPPDDDSPASRDARQTAAQGGKEPVLIQAKPWLFNRETRYAHSLPEVDGATITVTKKTSVVQLDNQ